MIEFPWDDIENIDCSYLAKSSGGLYKIAVLAIDNYLDGSYFDEEDKGEKVLGRLNEDRVNYYITKIGRIERK